MHNKQIKTIRFRSLGRGKAAPLTLIVRLTSAFGRERTTNVQVTFPNYDNMSKTLKI